ncbi:MAG: alanine racemase [bacterium]|nr:alanine racemase [bacterium]
MYTLQQIAEITGVKYSGTHNSTVLHFLNDSRNLQSPEDTLFIALKTARNNGHRYVAELVKKGVRSFLVKKNEVETHLYPEASFLISEDPLKTIQDLAAFHRKQFSLPVIGITGSNGKTVVKEWLYQCLKDQYSICRSPKSYNSQIGVALSVLNLNEEHTLAIFEAGISLPGEMEKLRCMILPDLGVLTTIGSAHDEGFSGKETKIEEKFKLFSASKNIVVNGLPRVEVPVQHWEKCVFVGETKKFIFKIPFTDEASLANAQTCAAVLLQLGLSEKIIAEKLMQLQPLALRLEIKNGINNSLIINDFYNSDLDSLQIALNFLQQQNRRVNKIIIVSDIEQSGMPPVKLYRHLSELFVLNKIDLAIGIGKEISQHASFFPGGSHFFDDTQSFLDNLKTLSSKLHNATILLKGARSFGFENIARLLQQKSHDTVFEINLNRLTDNINYFRSLLDSKVQVMCMVKAMGYGSGGVEIARTLEHMGVHYLAVAYADEGVELRESQITLPIMVMNPEEDSLDDIITYHLEPEIYNFRVLNSFIAKLDNQGITESFPIHLKIDTGMHRLGFEEKDLQQLCAQLDQLPQIKVKSVFSHLVGTDNNSLDDFTNEQIKMFEEAVSMIEGRLGYPVIKHLCNSAGITRFKNAHFNMVRLGIGMYGMGVNAAEQKLLYNVGTLKTKISQIKEVSAGETVGYNRNALLTKGSRIATVPIGYADGFSRMLGNGNHGMYVRGHFCKTVGNVCMDMCMLDVSAINCAEGDEVIVFENAEQIKLMANALNSISYEVLTNLSARVKRVYVQE